MNIVEIEELLINSVHSDKDAEKYFIENLQNEELFYILLKIVQSSVYGDARMESAYYISRFNENFLKKEESRLLVLMDDEWDSVAIHIMMALAKIKSKKALKKIIEQRIKPVLEWEAQALENYLQEMLIS